MSIWQAERTLEDVERRIDIDRMLSRLTPREAEVLRMRMGFDEPPMTMQEIGDEFGRNRERIRQIEAKALRRLRYPTRSKDYWTPAMRCKAMEDGIRQWQENQDKYMREMRERNKPVRIVDLHIQPIESLGIAWLDPAVDEIQRQLARRW